MPTYHLDCTACSFTETVHGDVDEVLDRVDAHRDVDGEYEHFVEFEVVEW